MYITGIDVGGTFTDCVVVDDDGHISMDKAFTTPGDLSQGILTAVTNTCASLGKSIESLLAETRVFALGTTSLTNRVVSRTGARIGLLTTKGHEDAILIGRLLSRTDGLRETERYDISAWSKPEPMVIRKAVKGISERVDSCGEVVVSLDQEAVRRAVGELEALGVESVAVVFLWSFLNPTHERMARSIIRECAPHISVSLSCEVAPTLGEYERATTTILNAFLAPGARQDLEVMEARLRERGLKHRLLVMQSHGGLGWSEEIERVPIKALAAGPVGGVMGAAKLASLSGYRNAICTDMGGTSFDVGLVIDGQPRFANESIIERYRIRVPTVEITSIGAGGGSIASVDSVTGELRVGPRSAGSVPGPVCYGRGGVEPTVTDADVILGRIDPGSFWGGRITLDKQGALNAVREKIAEPLGIDVVEAARGICDIVDARMADLIRALTVEKGHDPRSFVLFAYGGAGPTHVGAYASQIGVERVVIPLYASVQSAFGIATADLRRYHSIALPLREPFDASKIEATFEDLESSIRAAWAGVGVGEASYHRSVDMRFRHQVHEIRVPVQKTDDASALVERFLELYEQTFGSGAAIRNAGTEMLTFHVVSSAQAAKLLLPTTAPGERRQRALSTSIRKVYFSDAFYNTPVFDLRSLSPAETVVGPAIIEAPSTTIVVHQNQTAAIDVCGNVILELGSSGEDG